MNSITHHLYPASLYQPATTPVSFSSDVPPDVTSFTITVHNTGKRGKESEVAELTVELANLANGEEIEEWYPLAGMTPIGEWGSLRLRIR